MSKARLVVTAVIVERRPVREVARSYGVARSWVYTLVGRYRAEGEAAFEPRSRRPTNRSRARARSKELMRYVGRCYPEVGRQRRWRLPRPQAGAAPASASSPAR